jgi:hypothetical protein
MLCIRAALVASALSVPFLLGCGDPAALDQGGQAAFGTLSMPLATVVNGVHYRLATGRFSLSGPVEIDRLQENGSGTIVIASLPEGDYEVTLHDGWVLERQMESGFEAVVAELASPNPRPVRIESEQTTMVAWLFRTDAELVGPEPPGLLQGNLAVADSTNPATSILGDVLALAPDHVDALAGIVSIDGSLAIEDDVSTLTALSSLTRIEGDLIISGTALTSLAGLEGLAEVGGAVEITDNAGVPTCAAEALAAQLGIDSADAEISGNDDAGVCP